MNDNHQLDLVPYLKKLYNLSYGAAKELLHEIDSLPKETNLKLFWRLACILYDDEQDELQDNFNQWIQESIQDIIPKEGDCDPFLRALLLNDIEEAKNTAMDISPKLPLVFVSPTKSVEDAKNVPPFMKNRDFKYKNITISGSAIWALIMGDISEILNLDLPWISLFALHYWNSDDSISSSLLAAFSSFCNSTQSRIQIHEQDPLYLLMKYYSQDYGSNYGDKLLADIASLLPPLDMFFFLKIFQAIDHQNVSENSLSLALNIAQYQLMQMNCLKEAVDILNNDQKNNSEEIFQLAQYSSSPECGLTEIERYIIKTCPNTLDKSNIYFFKGNKAQILQEEFTDTKSLDYAGRATDFFLESAGIIQNKHELSSTSSTTNSNSNDSNESDQNTNESNDSDFNDNDFENEDIELDKFLIANYQAYDVYLIKAMMKGEGLEKLFNWSGKFARHPDIADISDKTQIYKIFEAIKVAQKGETVDQSLLETIADEIKKNTKLYPRFRYYVASKFIAQPNGFTLFSDNEMTPKEKLLEIYEKAFQ